MRSLQSETAKQGRSIIFLRSSTSATVWWLNIYIFCYFLIPQVKNISTYYKEKDNMFFFCFSKARKNRLAISTIKNMSANVFQNKRKCVFVFPGKTKSLTL